MRDFLIDSINFISKSVLFILFLFLILSVVIIPVYDFSDMPKFELINGKNACCIIVILFIFYLFYNKYFNNIAKVFTVKKIIFCFVIVSIIYIFLIPLNPFSDMEQVFNGAKELSDFNFSILKSEYFVRAPNNIVICFIYAFIFIFLPKSIITLKVFNVFIICVIYIILRKILELRITLNNKKNIYFTLVYFTFLPLLLYENHIYTDIIFIQFITIAVFLYQKEKYVCSFSILLLAYFIRAISIIYIVAFIICIIKENKIRVVLDNYRKKNIIIISLFLFFTINMWAFPKLTGSSNSLPIASYVYIGLNEPEFGFQDGTHSVDRSWNEVKERLFNYSFSRFLKMELKKNFWIWGEGTYQTARYAFGEKSENQFQYKTILTDKLGDEKAPIRKILDWIMRIQYWVMSLFTITYLFMSKDHTDFLPKLLFSGFFLFYVVWEMKSRYILPLYPWLIYYFVLSSFLIKEKGIRGVCYENEL